MILLQLEVKRKFMHRALACKCKTPGCPAVFPICDMPEDTFRTTYVALRLDEEPKRLLCPECNQTHDYVPADKKEVQFQS